MITRIDKTNQLKSSDLIFQKSPQNKNTNKIIYNNHTQYIYREEGIRKKQNGYTKSKDINSKYI